MSPSVPQRLVPERSHGLGLLVSHCRTRRYASYPGRFSKSLRRGNRHHRSPFDFLIEKKTRGTIYGSHCSRRYALRRPILKSDFLVRRKIGLWILANGRPMASVTKVCPKLPSRHTGWTRPCMGEAWPLRPSSGLTFCALGAAWGSDARTGVNVDGFIKKTEYLGGPFGPALCAPSLKVEDAFLVGQVAKFARQHFLAYTFGTTHNPIA